MQPEEYKEIKVYQNKNGNVRLESIDGKNFKVLELNPTGAYLDNGKRATMDKDGNLVINGFIANDYLNQYYHGLQMPTVKKVVINPNLIFRNR